MPSTPRNRKTTEGADTAGDSDYEAHFHHAACGYLVLTTDGIILDVNQTLLSWTGRSREELLATNVVNLLRLGDQVLYAAYAMPQLAVSGRFNEMAAELVSAAGPHVPVLLSGMRSASGTTGDDVEVDRIAVFNVSERSRHERELRAALRKAEAAEAARAAAEEKLREKQTALEEKDRVLKANLAASKEREALLDTVLNAVDVGLLVLDEEGNVVLANAHLMSAWNRFAGESGRDRLIFAPDPEPPISDAESPLRRAAAGESFSNQLLWFGPAVGEQQTALSVSARPIKTDGVVSGSVVAYSDVSTLVTALAAQEEFVANVSHELRTPLTSIMGYLDLALEEEGAPPAVTSALQVALRNSERLLALVSDLLSVASGAQKVDRQPVNLAEIVRSGVVSVAPKARANQVDLVTEIPETLPVEVDPQRLAQVVDNLLSNAVKYSPDGGIVTVQLSKEGEEIRLRVSDTGIGMDEAEQDRVFTKFFRAHRAVTSAIPGVGLGLVITKSIVEAHGGTLSFVSIPGQGSVFTVSLPLTAVGRT